MIITVEYCQIICVIIYNCSVFTIGNSTLFFNGLDSRTVIWNSPMHFVQEKFLPRLLSNEQDICICTDSDISQRWLRFLTGDDIWIYSYDPETKEQLLLWHTIKSPNSLWLKKHGQKFATIQMCFFLHLWDCLQKFLSLGETINVKFYCDIWLNNAIWSKCPEKWKNNWFLHQDSLPVHTSFVIWQIPAFNNVTVILNSL